MKLTYVAYSPLDLQSANSIQTFHTCQALAARLAGDLTVIVPRFAVRDQVPPFRVVKIPRVPLNKLSRLYRTVLWSYFERTIYAWIATLYLKFHHADVVYARDVICAFWLASFGVRVIYEVHDLESRHPSQAKGALLSSWLARIDERTIRDARSIVTLTETFKDELARSGWQPAERVFVIPDAYDEVTYYPRSLEEARAGLNLLDDQLVIGYAGMTFAYRRLDLLLEAIKVLHEPRAHALIIGGRPSEVDEIERRAKEMGLEGAVLCRGREAAEATARDLSAADILVIPDTVTDAGASPLKMFEYMALGRAIVAVDRPALREILSPGTAEFFRPGDAQDFARALRVVAESKQHREELGARARVCVREYTYSRRADKIVKACESTI
jgi:glycosyltransferase involved in cell wall biosynthesis